MNTCRILAVILSFLAAFPLYATSIVREPPISEEEKLRIAEVVDGALEAGDITRGQHFNTMSWLNSYPCEGVDRSLSDARKASLENAISTHSVWSTVKVLGSFKLGSWQILYLSNQVSDEPYLCYPADPVNSKSLGAWAGAASIFESEEVRRWTLENIPEIPGTLASCFAWHVTLNRRE